MSEPQLLESAANVRQMVREAKEAVDVLRRADQPEWTKLAIFLEEIEGQANVTLRQAWANADRIKQLAMTLTKGSQT